MPLILVCSTYAYFKIVPLKYGVPILVGVFVILQIRGQVKTLREKKIENMDESDMNDLALELEDDAEDKKKKEEEARKLEKKKARLAERLAAEERKAEKAAKRNQGKKKSGDDDDEGDVTVFAKGSRNQKKKN
ncbi:unnamed protein product [Pseudo-nitzschia multistriata]|uniref:Uncharacterized protein n=1 Tax=Pseudo-nitzschia multistriata TaxID=183589 RepID=A0A448ZMC9_9STRA|nr:unnamed protein product [Pseudo-nitzschia multistriata]